MNFQTFTESRLDAIKCFASMFECSMDYATSQIDAIVMELRRQCESQGKPNATRKIQSKHYSFKIDTTYLTFD